MSLIGESLAWKMRSDLQWESSVQVSRRLLNYENIGLTVGNNLDPAVLLVSDVCTPSTTGDEALRVS